MKAWLPKTLKAPTHHASTHHRNQSISHASPLPSHPTPQTPMRSPSRNPERVPQINAVLQRLMQDEVVPQFGKQLASQWETLSAGLQAPSMPGCISTPEMHLSLPEVLNRLGTGDLKLTLPLKPGPIDLAGFRQVVKPGTYLDVTVSVHEGKIDPEATQLSVWRCQSSGSGASKRSWFYPSKLSGPAAPLPGLRRLGGFKGLKFDDKGNFKVKLVGFSWNLNKLLELPSERPLAAGEFISKLLSKTGVSTDIPIAEMNSYAMTVSNHDASSSRADKRLSAEPRPRIGGSASTAQDAALARASTVEPKADAVEAPDWIDWEGLHFQFSGEFLPGDLAVGDQSVLALKPGTRVTIEDANPRTLDLKFSAELENSQLSAKGSHWFCGPGRAAFDLTLESPEPLGAPDRVSLRFSEVDLENVALQVPANIEDGFGRPLNHQVHLSALKITADDDTADDDTADDSAKASSGKPLIAYDNSAARTVGSTKSPARELAVKAESDSANDSPERAPSATLMVNLPEVRLEKTSALLHTVGAGFGSGRLQMGLEDGVWAKDPMTIVATLNLDTRANVNLFAVQGQVEAGRLDLIANGEGRQARMGLVSSRHLAMGARAIRLEGNGEFGFRQVGQQSPHLRLTSDVHEQPWRVVIEDYDAQLLDPKQGLLIELYDQGSQRNLSLNDIQGQVEPASDRTRSQLMVRSLGFGGDLAPLPSFDAAGVLAVTLGGLQYRGAQSDKNFNLQGGSHGELLIQKAYWAPHAPSPEVDAQLQLTAGGDVRFTASEIKTLEGADIGLRIGDQGAHLQVDFKAQPDGRVTCDSDLSLREGQVRTRVLQMTPIQFAELKQTLRTDPNHPMALSTPTQAQPLPLPPRAGFQLTEPSVLARVPLNDVASGLRLETMDDLILALIPKLKLNTQFMPILHAVQDAEVSAELPLEGMQKNLPEGIKLPKNARSTLQFAVSTGKVTRGKINFEPGLNIRWGVFNFNLKEIDLANGRSEAEGGNALVVRPSVGIKFLGLPTYVPANAQAWAAGKLLQSFLGRPDLPDQLSPLVSVLTDSAAGLSEQLAAHLVIEPNAQHKKVRIHAGLGPYKAPQARKGDEQAVSDKAAAGLPANVRQTHAAQAPAIGASDSTNTAADAPSKGATVMVKAAKVDAFQLALGEGQLLACGPNSKLFMTLQDDKLQLQGRLDLSGESGATKLQTPGGYTLSFAEGGTDINAVFSVDAAEKSHCELTGLFVKDLSLTADALGFSQTMKIPEVRDGKLVLDLENGAPKLSCTSDTSMAGAPFSLALSGNSAVSDQRYGAKGLSVVGRLKEIEFTEKGLSLWAPSVNFEAEALMLPLGEGQHVVAQLPTLSAQAKITVDVRGGAVVDFLNCQTCAGNDKAANTATRLTLYDQQVARDNFQFGPITAEKLTFAFGSGVAQPGFSGQQIRCDELVLEKSLDLFQENAEEDSALGLKKIRFEQGAVTLKDLLISETDYRFEGEVQSGQVGLDDLLLRAGGLALHAPQLDCSGDMKFKISADTLTLLPLDRKPLEIKGALSELELVTRSPEMSLLLKGLRQLPDGQSIGPTLDGKLLGIELSQGGITTGTVRFADTVLRGRLDQGDIVVGPDDSALNRVQLHSGEADAEIQTLQLQLADDGQSDPALLLRARLRVDSEVRDVRTPDQSVPLGAEQGSAQTLPVQLYVERMGVHGQLNLTMDALLQTGPDDLFNAWIESAAEVGQAGANIDIRGQIDDLRQNAGASKAEDKPALAGN